MCVRACVRACVCVGSGVIQGPDAGQQIITLETTRAAVTKESVHGKRGICTMRAISREANIMPIK